MTEPTSAKADIVPYTGEFASVVRSWIDSEETLYFLCRGREFPPAEDLVDSWQRPDVTSFLLFAERKPVAYGELWPRPAERAVEIAHLIVDPYKRSLGFGTKLLQLLYQQAAVRRETTEHAAARSAIPARYWVNPDPEKSSPNRPSARAWKGSATGW